MFCFLVDSLYSQESTTKYVINSTKFHKAESNFDEKNRSFKININDEICVFKQIDSNPTIINDSE